VPGIRALAAAGLFLRDGRRLWRIGLDGRSRFILPQALKGGLAHKAIRGPAGEFDLGDEFGLQPDDVLLPLWRADPREGRCVGLYGFQLGYHNFPETPFG
jgi:hypothetical protein